jgi:protoporphyrinogen oxidase
MSPDYPRRRPRLADCRIAIIGAGPTGLGAAHRLDELGVRNFTVFERDAHAGGLAASFRDPAGFTWDVGGHVQFSHYAYFDRVMDRAMGTEWLFHERESWVWIRNRFIPYPFQNNVHLLPDPERRDCILGLVRVAMERPPRPANFAEWIRATFGDGIAETFMLPYNAKVWAHAPSDLDYGWVSERVAQPDLERIIRNLLDGRFDAGWGPNNRFRFPTRGGTGEIWRRVAAALPDGSIRYHTAVSRVGLDRRSIWMEDGTREDYDVLISTMPLGRLAAITDGSSALSVVRRLKHSTVHVFGIGLSGTAPPPLAKKCWIYFPENVCPFYRLTVFSNYSPGNVPDPARHWSVMVEVSESPERPADRDRLQDAVVGGLLRAGVISTRAEIVSCWSYTADYGYPTPALGRDAVVVPVLEWLEQHDVYSRGRFGAWKYEVSNQDHSFMQGVELVDRLTSGAAETTLRNPGAVNAVRR